MKPRQINECECSGCQSGDERLRAQHHQLNLLMSRLDERQRRWLAAMEANRLGHGGTEHLHQVTGLDINTIHRGRRELANELRDCPLGRIRAEGGGRHRLERKKSV